MFLRLHGVVRILRALLFLFPGIALLFAPVLPGLTLRILRRYPGLGVRQPLSLGGCRLPGCGVETGLFQPGRQGRQILTEFPSQSTVGGSHGYQNVAATFRHAHLYARLSVSADLKFDVVRRRLDGRGRGIGWQGGGGGRRFRGGGVLRRSGTRKRLDLL